MQISDGRGDWFKDHPTGEIAFRYLLKGDPGSRDNFLWILGRQDKDFFMPRHRHNFEQIRLPLRGDMNIGNGIVLKEGQIGYFPEGLPYGPQADPLGDAAPGERVQLVLQFGGSSGYGFMSMEQRKAAWAELQKKGKFEGPQYVRADGSRQWGLNAVWEHVFGTKLHYPKPRYQETVLVDPRQFHWLPVENAPGVERKYFGSFTERAFWMEMVRMSAGATWSSLVSEARRLAYVLKGAGRIGADLFSAEYAVQVEPGEPASIAATEPLELFIIGLPPVRLPEVSTVELDGEEFDLAPTVG